MSETNSDTQDNSILTTVMGLLYLDENKRKCILAGALIAMAGMFSMSVAGYGSLVQGLCFSVGLFGVFCAESILFTGRMLSVRYVMNEEIQLRTMLSEWVGVWVYNLVGAILMSALAKGCGFDSSAIASAKASISMLELFIRAILCNIMVCMAVESGRWQTKPSERLFACILPVACFVTCGFEHSVADMFYMTLGVFSGGVGLVDTVRVLAVATAGNIVGGTMYAIFGYTR